MKNGKTIYDEILEQIWMKKEEGSVKKNELLELNDPAIKSDILEKMIDEDYLFEVNSELNLSDKGNDIARKIIRSHRMAERLFVDIFDLGDSYIEKNACVFEHILINEVTEAVCTLLGHPAECPHGRPIPRGVTAASPR
ncbi:MAG: iron dependent repressor, metal binding and dimerization domain protein [bacterium]